MVEKKYAEAPLLYIDQPSVKQPEAEMQHQYKSKRKNSEKQPVKEQEKGETTYHSAAQTDKVDPDTEENEEKTSHEKQVQPGKRKPFKEMSIKEKVLYFVHSSSYAPKVKCEVKTTSRRYRGVITDLEGQEVILETGARSVTVPLDDIKDIRLIGF